MHYESLVTSSELYTLHYKLVLSVEKRTGLLSNSLFVTVQWSLPKQMLKIKCFLTQIIPKRNSTLPGATVIKDWGLSTICVTLQPGQTDQSKNCQNCVVTARKRSLGQGKVFTPVCQSFCSQGWREYLPLGLGGVYFWVWGCLPLDPGGACLWVQEISASPEYTPPWHTSPWAHTLPDHIRLDTPHGQQSGGTHPTGMLSCFFSFTCAVFLLQKAKGLFSILNLCVTADQTY